MDLLGKLRAAINSTTASCGNHVSGVSVTWADQKARVSVAYTCAAPYQADTGHEGVEMAVITPPDDDVFAVVGSFGRLEAAVLDAAWQLGAWDVLRVIDSDQVRWHFRPTWRSLRLVKNDDNTLDPDGTRPKRNLRPQPVRAGRGVYQMGRSGLSASPIGPGRCGPKHRRQKMEQITLNRTGDRQLQFAGEELASASSRTHQGPCENRWWELALYRSESGKLIVSISYRTQWQGEHATDTVYVCDTAEEIAETLRVHPYSAGVYGFPPGHGERQERLNRALDQCWYQAVTEILSAVGPEKI